jgi:hypothetical protein
MRLIDLCADVLLAPYGMTHADLPILVPEVQTNERYQCQDCNRMVLLTIHGRCGVCNSMAVLPLARLK